MRRVCLVLAVGMMAGTWGGCAGEERVVRYKPFLANVRGAEHVTPPVTGQEPHADPLAYSGEIVVEEPDGSIRLVSRNIRHLMTHVERLLDAGEDQLLLDQIIAEETKRRYRLDGRAESEIVADLADRRPAIAVLFSRMPFAERTPAVRMTKERRGIRGGPPPLWKLELTGVARRGSELTELWVAQEGGEFRLVWVR